MPFRCRLLSELAKHVSSEKLEAIKLEDGLEQMEPDVTVSANKKQAGDEVAKPNGRAGSMPQKQIEFKNDGFSLVRSLLKAQHSFVISDPLLADNPIIYASNGFYDMTGYYDVCYMGGEIQNPRKVLWVFRF